MKALFGDWKSPQPYRKIVRDYQKVDPLLKAIETPDKQNSMWIAGLPIKMKDTDPDYPALVLGNYILGNGFNSRLFARIRGKEGLSYGIGSVVQATPKEEETVFISYAICAPQNAPKVEASFKDEMKNILEKGYTADEVQAAKKSWAESRKVSRANDAELVQRLVSGLHYDRTMAFDAELEAKVQALTPDQIRAVMDKYILLDSLSFVRAGDFKKVNVTW